MSSLDETIAEIKAVNDSRFARYEARREAELRMRMQGPWFLGFVQLPCGHGHALDTRSETRFRCAACRREYVAMGVSVEVEAEDY